jgi:hypothetical protein
MVVSPPEMRNHETAAVFTRDRYVVLPKLLQDPTLSYVYSYACALAATPEVPLADNQIAGTPCVYGNPVMNGLLTKLLPDVERSCGLALFPTCSYFRAYKRGATLARHTDRPACEISITLCLGYGNHSPWPIWIEGPYGMSSVDLDRGDALLYRGIECPHWREAFEGDRQVQVFLHYVDQKGPLADWKFDKRPVLFSRNLAAAMSAR